MPEPLKALLFAAACCGLAAWHLWGSGALARMWAQYPIFKSEEVTVSDDWKGTEGLGETVPPQPQPQRTIVMKTDGMDPGLIFENASAVIRSMQPGPELAYHLGTVTMSFLQLREAVLKLRTMGVKADMALSIEWDQTKE